MKTKNKLAWSYGAAALLALLPPALPAAETTGAATAQKSDPPTHMLFTGADIQVQHRRALHRVRGVEGDAFIIKVENESVKVPMGLKPEELKVSRVVRLTDRTASVTKFKYDRAYTPGNDPVRKWAPAMAATAEMNAAALTAENQLNNTPETMTVREGSGPTATFKSVPNPQHAVASANAMGAASRISGNLGTAGAYAEKIAEEEAQELFDALDVQFEVSAAKPIRNPYLVVTAIYHEKDDPKYTRKWLFAKALDPIEAEPRHVYVREAGFPRGFVVKQLEVHLYEKGVEIATDLSENRAPLTRDEAHEYLVIEYLSAHKEDTIPARVALTKVPDDWATRPKGKSFHNTYYVKVNKEGHALESFEDEACRTKASDPSLEAALEGLLFLPALESGKAVDSVVQIKPADLAM